MNPCLKKIGLMLRVEKSFRLAKQPNSEGTTKHDICITQEKQCKISPCNDPEILNQRRGNNPSFKEYLCLQEKKLLQCISLSLQSMNQTTPNNGQILRCTQLLILKNKEAPAIPSYSCLLLRVFSPVLSVLHS